MSRVTTLSCDRCGAEIPDYYKPAKDNSAKILLNAPGEYRGCGGQRIDLCIECYSKFVNFLESGTDND